MRASSRTLTVPCTVEIENSAETLHAHVSLDGYDVGPGDEVIVHGAPTDVPFGEKIVARCHATVTRATPIDRLRAKIEGYLELTELYEVGFSEGGAS
ncbi:hypothetical protein [Pseudorhodoplanes sp.]|uniref:hypothetical protein n=1 Tax=Pseudorhodoplanes sp. TaxID=1934341 RepID=UPI00391DAC14